MNFYQTYIIPTAVFQGVIIGGGYATGREIVEYVSRHGAAGGFVALAVIAIGFSLVLAASFAFAQRFQAYDYRHFLRRLLGPAWLAYEILFGLLLVLVLAVVAAAAVSAGLHGFGLPPPATLSLMVAIVAVLGFLGRAAVEQALVVWSVLFMLGLLACAVFIVGQTSAPPDALPASAANTTAPVLSGLKFAVYNSALIPALVYCVAGIRSTGAAARAGVLAGVFGVLPALLLHIVFMHAGTALLAAPVPTLLLLETYGLEAALPAYFVLLFGTLVLTATGVLQGVNDRIDGWRRDRGQASLAPALHAGLSAGVVVVSLLLAKFGVIALVARGYGTLSWLFLVVFTLPLLTRGLYLLYQSGESAHAS